MSQRQAIPPEMARLAKQIATWRAERERFGPMPAKLWSEAVELAEQYEVGPTARGLKIDFGGLKQRVERAREEQESVAAEATSAATTDERSLPEEEPVRFVELPDVPLMAPASTETTVEVTHPDGAAMTARR
ncbi:MAG: hypothetical protein GY719_02065 [bacterium]|nr:hypothetical protein [bacterium]